MFQGVAILGGVRVMPGWDGGSDQSAYGLGALAGDPVYAARGEQGLIWRLDARSGWWAVKELLLPGGEAGAAGDVEFQLAARAAGIPLPLPRCTRDGRVVLPAEEAGSAWSVRVYRWADVCGGQPVTSRGDRCGDGPCASGAARRCRAGGGIVERAERRACLGGVARRRLSRGCQVGRGAERAAARADRPRRYGGAAGAPDCSEPATVT